MIQILTPNYQGLANLPQPNPIGQGLSAFYQAQANQRAQQLSQLQQTLGGLEAQKAQTELQYLPKSLQTKQQQAQADLQKQILANQASKMTYDQARTQIFQNRMADVAQAPLALQAQEYQKARNDFLKLGGNPNRIPKDYTDPMAKQMAQEGLRQSAAMTEQRKFQNDLLIQVVKNKGELQAAQIKQAGTQTELDKKESDANSAYKTSVMGEAQNAQNVLADANNIQASLNQAFSGYTGTLANWNSKEGQLLKKNTAQLVLDRLQGMKNVSRGTNLLTGIIQRSKPADWMKRGAIERIVAGLNAVSNRSIQKEQFTQFMWEHGITDRIKIDNLWNKYDAQYPLIDVKTDTVNMKNVGRWAEFLRNNRTMVDKLRGITGGGQ